VMNLVSWAFQTLLILLKCKLISYGFCIANLLTSFFQKFLQFYLFYYSYLFCYPDLILVVKIMLYPLKYKRAQLLNVSYNFWSSKSLTFIPVKQQINLIDNVSDLCLESAQFESLLWCWLPWPRFFMVFPSIFRKIPG
jgi:hypothetical protein